MPRIAVIDPNTGTVLNVIRSGPAAETITEIELDDADTTTWVGSIISNPNTNAATIRTQAQTALSVNDFFLGLASPTNPQTLLQVQRMTRQLNGIIRLLLNKLDTTSGT